MTIPLSLDVRLARVTALRDKIDAGGGGKLLAYTLTNPNPLPATPETATTETLLGEISLAAVCGAVTTSGALAVLTATVPQVDLAIATGVVGFVRVVNFAGAGIMDLPAGLAGSGLPVIFSDTQVYQNGELQLISFVLTEA